ncbi:class I SAM-dependent methyltransferase [Mesorhizobium muleiense]|uniref:class I SAM-dependent methyltransferase n=1 Tax=Mesorhizobium muleiense TaxID=1004279 RepID=UPI001F40AA2A|nr:class I SAM-dependent methyltransferase [Mesorhizobium muleiense]MCF6109134.1 class I SAM-dependent methyltransferase [Mesorhizobium muleiense]
MAYDRGRPGYPSRIYTILQERCGVGPATTAFEIGSGTGQATRELLDLGLWSVMAIEPDERLAVFLSDNLGRTGGGRLEVLTSSFLDADLPEAAFDLGIAATAFHWVEPIAGLAKVRRLLRPGGWWAMWWSIFGDPGQPDEFQKASQPLFSIVDSSPFGGSGLHHALAVDRRIGELAAAGFEEIQHEAFRWTTVLSTDQVLALTATFSPVIRLAAGDRAHLMDGLKRIAQNDFGGSVTRTFITSIYTACRGLP